MNFFKVILINLLLELSHDIYLLFGNSGRYHLY